MTEGDWVTEKGNTGEVPVKIHPDGEAEFLLGFADGVRIGSMDLAIGEDPSIADVCILTIRVDGVDEDNAPTLIDVTVTDIEYIRRADEEQKELTEMMQHLDEARAGKADREGGCDNCAPVTADTKLMAMTDQGTRDLHYCARCGRLLSTDEYREWTGMQ